MLQLNWIPLAFHPCLKFFSAHDAIHPFNNVPDDAQIAPLRGTFSLGRPKVLVPGMGIAAIMPSLTLPMLPSPVPASPIPVSRLRKRLCRRFPRVLFYKGLISAESWKGSRGGRLNYERERHEQHVTCCSNSNTVYLPRIRVIFYHRIRVPRPIWCIIS